MSHIASEKPSSTAAKDASEIDNLQFAQVLADLNQLQNASDQKAALSLLQIKKTLDRRQSLSKKTLPTPENVYGTLRKRDSSSLSGYGMHPMTPGDNEISNPSSAARARAESKPDSRPSITPLVRGDSVTSSSSSAVISRASSNASNSTLTENAIPTPQTEDPDLLRAQTLLNLHSKRSSLLRAAPSYTSPSIKSDPSSLEIARRTVGDVLSKYSMLKQEEMERDPEGMRAALGGVGLV